MEIKQVTCTRCAYSWYPAKPELPKSCANCHSTRWNKPKVRTQLPDASQTVRKYKKTVK